MSHPDEHCDCCQDDRTMGQDAHVHGVGGADHPHACCRDDHAPAKGTEHPCGLSEADGKRSELWIG